MTPTMKQKEEMLTKALCHENGLRAIGDSIRKLMIGEWRPGNGSTCYKCNSTNIEVQLGALEHWSGLRKRCKDCGYYSYGIRASLRKFIIVEEINGNNPSSDK